MRVVLQRVRRASVRAEGRIAGEIDRGVVLFVGFTHDDAEPDLTYLADKIVNLRIFEDDEGKMNESLLDAGGGILSISQFTLYAETRKGRRPSFLDAARPEVARPLYERFNDLLRATGMHVQTGVFGAMMDVELVNDGPVTIWLDTDHL
jgi:D-tyrosyl-tRNA(Tyr) deacylase